MVWRGSPGASARGPGCVTVAALAGPRPVDVRGAACVHRDAAVRESGVALALGRGGGRGGGAAVPVDSSGAPVGPGRDDAVHAAVAVDVVRPVFASSTTRARNSVGYGGFGFGIVGSFSHCRADSTKPTQLQSRCCCGTSTCPRPSSTWTASVGGACRWRRCDGDVKRLRSGCARRSARPVVLLRPGRVSPREGVSGSDYTQLEGVGNHEYYSGGPAWEAEVARLGFTVRRASKVPRCVWGPRSCRRGHPHRGALAHRPARGGARPRR